MKKLTLVLVMVFSVMFSQAQVELKGVILGDSLTESVEDITLGGKKGNVFAYKISDNRNYFIIFDPVDRYNSSDIEILQAGLEKKFGITYKKRSDGNSYTLRALKDGVTYYISAKHNRYMSPRYKIAVYLIDDELNDINKAEEKAKASADF